MTMADGKRPTWEHAIPVALGFMAYFNDGLLEALLSGLCGAWIAILFMWHSGWRKQGRG